MISFNFVKKRRAIDAAYRRVFNSPDGKLILQDLMEQHSITGTTFDPNPQVSALKEGERNVVLRVMSILDMSSEKVLEKIKEHSAKNAEFYMEDIDG